MDAHCTKMHRDGVIKNGLIYQSGFKTKQMQLVVITHTLERLPHSSVQKVLQEMHRISNGYLVVNIGVFKGEVDTNIYPHFQSKLPAPIMESREWWLAEFQRAGFEVQETATARFAHWREAMLNPYKREEYPSPFFEEPYFAVNGPEKPSGGVFHLFRANRLRVAKDAPGGGDYEGKVKPRKGDSRESKMLDAAGIYRNRPHKTKVGDYVKERTEARREAHRKSPIKRANEERDALRKGKKPPGYTAQQWKKYTKNMRGDEVKYGHYKKQLDKLDKKLNSPLRQEVKDLGQTVKQLGSSQKEDTSRMSQEVKNLDKLMELRKTELEQRQGWARNKRLTSRRRMTVKRDIQRLTEEIAKLDQEKQSLQIEIMHREAEWSNAADKTVRRHRQKQRELIKRQSHVDRARADLKTKFNEKRKKHRYVIGGNVKDKWP